jgi:glycosyltransferase involved in cell wall biosynthesis
MPAYRSAWLHPKPIETEVVVRPMHASAVVTWCAFQPRTQALAAAMGASLCNVSHPLHRRKVLLPLRYLIDAVSTWRFLRASRPRAVIVTTPPVFNLLTCWLWCALHRRPLVADCHTGTFHDQRWRWALPIQRVLLRRARVALVHSEEDEVLVNAWRAPALLLPDDLPRISETPSPTLPTRGREAAPPRVVVAGRLDHDEPVAAVLRAASLLPDVEVRLTGNPDRLPAAVHASAPSNAVFTGLLPWDGFMSELASADVVGVFTTDPHVMSRAAFEAVGLGRPLVLSDSAGLRHRFGSAALFSENTAEPMARVLQQALRERASLAERSLALRELLHAHHQRALAQLRLMLD